MTEFSTITRPSRAWSVGIAAPLDSPRVNRRTSFGIRCGQTSFARPVCRTWRSANVPNRNPGDQTMGDHRSAYLERNRQRHLAREQLALDLKASVPSLENLRALRAQLESRSPVETDASSSPSSPSPELQPELLSPAPTSGEKPSAFSSVEARATTSAECRCGLKGRSATSLHAAWRLARARI